LLAQSIQKAAADAFVTVVASHGNIEDEHFRLLAIEGIR
jgi:hypothetical protein